MSDIEDLLAKAEDDLKNNQDQIDKVSNDLLTMNSSLPTIEAALNDVYNKGNDANTRVKYATDDLNAAIQRFQ